MLTLPSFEYASPDTLEEAAQLLARWPDATLVSGGTDLYPNMKRLQTEPGQLVSLRRIARLRGVRDEGKGGIVVGANTTLAEIAASPVVAARCPVLVEAAASVGSPQVRNAATLGGNLCQDTRCSFYDMPATWREGAGFCLKKGGESCLLAPGSERCWAVASSDLAPVAIALDASVHLMGVRGERAVKAKALYSNDGVSHLTKARDEIVVEMRIPHRSGLKAKYLKLRQRGAIDFPVLGVAVAVLFDKRRICRHARVVLGAVGSSPLEIRIAEAALVGSKLTVRAIGEASEAAYAAAKPLDNTAMTLQYRKAMVKVLVGRALKSLARNQV